MLRDEIEELKGSVEIMEKEVKEQTLALEIFQEMKVENKRKNVIIKILIALNLCFLIALVGSNTGWLIYESSFDTVIEGETTTVDGGNGVATYLENSNSGDINYGENN